MHLFITVYVLLLLGFVLLRFRKRFNAEHRRQEMITWPRTKAVFDADQIQLRAAKERPGAITILDRKYRFFTRGKEFNGHYVTPDEVHISPEQKTIINKLLNERREELVVRFNPAMPQENVLKVGHANLTWGHVFAYALFGVVIPVAMIYFVIARQGGPESWIQTITF